MAKKMLRLCSRNSKHKLGDKRDKFEEDRISELPNEVIVSILSLLTIKEAARTSVLSRRWERLWTLFNGSLNFDITSSTFTLLREYREQERSTYIDWVNRVLTSLDGSSSSTINDFIVHFDSDEDSRCHIDRWVAFALERRVQRLELDMKPPECDYTDAFMRYTFSLEFCTHIKQPCGLYSISALTSLCLKYVDITGELIEYFLSNCPLLECLCVKASEQLSILKVTGAAALRLKYLEISFCFNMESLEISAPNLLAFNYFGPRIKLCVENVPKLVELSIGRNDIINLVGSLSSYFSQIVTLTLDIDIKVHEKFTQHLELTKLKHLILKVLVHHDESLLGWTSLIRASPFLHKFTLELVVIKPRFRRRMQKVTECPHQCLKEVELVGFVGWPTDVELVMYLLASSSALEKIIVNCCRSSLIGTRWESEEMMVRKAEKKRALRLKRKLPPGVDLVVI